MELLSGETEKGIFLSHFPPFVLPAINTFLLLNFILFHEYVGMGEHEF